MESFENYFNEQSIREWWAATHSKDFIGDDKTVRAVAFTSTGTYTVKDKISGIDDLIEFIKKGYSKHGKAFGCSVSAAEFIYKPDQAPSRSTFLTTKTIVVDIDAYVPGTKKRQNLAILDDKIVTSAVAQAHVIIHGHAKQENFVWPLPKLMGVTGGGVQLIYEFDREMDLEEADRVFNFLKSIFPSKRYSIHIPNALGSIARVELEFDASSFDVVHVQRVLGTLNPKYDAFSRIIHGWTPQNIPALAMESFDTVLQALKGQGDTEEIKQEILKINSVKHLIISAFSTEKPQFSVDELNSYANILNFKPSSARTDMSNLEYKVAIALNEGRSFDIVRDELQVVRETPTFVALKCPFHEGDSHSSFAVYKNSGKSSFDVYYDFHDQKKYNIVSFYAKLHDISISQAIREIIDLSGINITKTDRKELEDIASSEVAESLLDQIDTDHFVYYRLSNKQRTCVIRHIDSGESFVFDGVKALTKQILRNQLKIENIDRKVLDEFAEVFENKLLIEGFERFEPGMPPVYNDLNVTIINTWVPTSNYKLAKAKAEEYDKMTLEEGMREIAKRCPYTNLYVCQIVQEGNLPWFYNWLALNAQFEKMPTVPFHYGNYGTGKNLFIETVLSWFLSKEYTNIVSTEQITKNFNAHMESSQLVIIDESNLYDSKSVDALKMLSGNSRVKIEKKGVDAVDVKRQFNFMSFSNREVPAYINTQERRFSFFRTVVPLSRTVQIMGIAIEDLLVKIRSELEDFFAILLNIIPVKNWKEMNIKDGSFFRIVLKSHSFGKLLLTLVEESWDNLSLQLTENMSDEAQTEEIQRLINNLREEFTSNGKLYLTLVNRYMDSINYKNRTSITEFIRQNNLGGIVKLDRDQRGRMFVHINVQALKELVKVENVLIKLLMAQGYLEKNADTAAIGEELQIPAVNEAASEEVKKYTDDFFNAIENGFEDSKVDKPRVEQDRSENNFEKTAEIAEVSPEFALEAPPTPSAPPTPPNRSDQEYTEEDSILDSAIEFGLPDIEPPKLE